MFIFARARGSATADTRRRGKRRHRLETLNLSRNEIVSVEGVETLQTLSLLNLGTLRSLFAHRRHRRG